jgi:hypothetical protein
MTGEDALYVLMFTHTILYYGYCIMCVNVFTS